jgi:hypothetical protein
MRRKRTHVILVAAGLFVLLLLGGLWYSNRKIESGRPPYVKEFLDNMPTDPAPPCKDPGCAQGIQLTNIQSAVNGITTTVNTIDKTTKSNLKETQAVMTLLTKTKKEIEQMEKEMDNSLKAKDGGDS